LKQRYENSTELTNNIYYTHIFLLLYFSVHTTLAKKRVLIEHKQKQEKDRID